MVVKAVVLLRRFEQCVHTYGDGAAARKLDLLGQLARRRLTTAGQVHRLHESLCFLQAYPDNAAVLEQVDRMLADFARRGDLRKHRAELADSGIAGADIYYSFFWPTALWLVKRFPDQLTIDWAEFVNADKLVDLLTVLMPACEQPALDMLDYSPRKWIDQLKGPGETDAAFLVRRFAALRASALTREKLYHDLDVPMRLAPGPPGAGTPARTLAKRPVKSVAFQTKPVSRDRPDLKQLIRQAPLRVSALSARDGQRWVDAAVEAMITRSRDLDAFAYGDRNDVRRVDCGQGVQIVCNGQIPERRLLLETVYGFLMIKNGVPIGYGLFSSLFNSSEVAYNLFETYRGAEAAHIFGCVLATAHRLFGAEAFSIDPYQLGCGNAEGLKSGAWWFYHKLGFQPEDAEVRRLMRIEQRRVRNKRGYRSNEATLEKLAAEPMFYYLGRARQDLLAKISIGELGLRISRTRADRFGADREKGVSTLSREAAKLLGVREQRSWSPGERQAWRRWSPLVMSLPGITRWPAKDKRALVRVVRAKGGRRESDYVNRFDQHPRLRRAILKLAQAAYGR